VEDRTVARLLAADVPRASPAQTAGDVRRALLAGSYESATDVAVVDGERLSLATAVAMLLPAVLAGLGRDPAFRAGPLATVIQDLLSIAAYFAIAVALLP
jgi:Mg/Co/Ni transporter MgtE